MARGGKREGAGRKKGSKIPVRLPPVKAEIKQELRELARENSDQRPSLTQLIVLPTQEQFVVVPRPASVR